MSPEDDKWYQNRAESGMMRYTHEFDMVRSPTGFDIPIDKPMVNIVRSIWKLGMSTQFSCENLNGRGRAQVIFQNPADALSVVGILMAQEPLRMSKSLLLAPMQPCGHHTFRMELTFLEDDIPTVQHVLMQWSGLEV